MSFRASWPHRRGLRKDIGNYTFYLGYSWDASHGRGWFCQMLNKYYKPGSDSFGFDKKSKFAAVSNAVRNLKKKTT